MMAAKHLIRAVLFDLDGVLVDAREWHYVALNRALGLFGYSISRFDHLTTLDGLPTSEKLKQLSVTDGLPRGLHRIINAIKQEYTRQIISTECYPVFRIEYTVARLKRESYQLAVCTNSVRETMDNMLKRSGLFSYFDVRLSNEDITRPKPDPEIYRTAISMLGRAPEECLVVEDNRHGVEAALASGAQLLRVTDSTEISYAHVARAITRGGEGK